MRDRKKKRIALILSALILLTNVNPIVFAEEYETESFVRQDSQEAELTDADQEETEEEITVPDDDTDNREKETEWILDMPEEGQEVTERNEEPETGNDQTNEKNGDRIRATDIASIQLTLAKAEYAAGVEAYFISGAAISIKDNSGKVLDYGTVTGESYTIHNIPDAKVEFWAQNETGSIGTCAPLNRGNYRVGVTVNDQWYQTDAILQIKSLEEMSRGELAVNAETMITASRNWGIYGCNLYTFCPSASGMYQINPCDVLSIYTSDQNQNVVQEYYERDETADEIARFYAKAGEKYYIGFTGDMDGQESWNTMVSLYQGTNEVISVTLRSDYKMTADRVFECNSYIDAVIDIAYANGDSDWITIWREGVTGDDMGHCFRCYLTDSSGDEVKEPAAGNYLVHIAYVNDPKIQVSYPLRITEPDHVPLQLDKMVGGKLKGGEKCYSYVPEKTETYLISLLGNFKKDSQAGLWICGGEWNHFYDWKSSKKISKKLQAGIRYFFVVMQNDESVSCDYKISIRDKEHSYVEDTKKPDCMTDGYVRQVCEICGVEKEGTYQKLSSKGHLFEEYRVIRKPTALKSGMKRRCCTVCGYAEEAEVPKLVSKIRLTTTRLPLQINQKISLIKIVTGMAEGDSIVSAVSENKKLAMVDNRGNVVGKRRGNVKIRLNFASGVSKDITIMVQKQKVEADRLIVSERNVTIKVKGKKKLIAKVTPVTSGDKIIFRISDKKIATVNKDGIITAREQGKAVLLVRAGEKAVKVRIKVIK